MLPPGDINRLIKELDQPGQMGTKLIMAGEPLDPDYVCGARHDEHDLEDLHHNCRIVMTTERFDSKTANFLNGDFVIKSVTEAALLYIIRKFGCTDIDAEVVRDIFATAGTNRAATEEKWRLAIVESTVDWTKMFHKSAEVRTELLDVVGPMFQQCQNRFNMSTGLKMPYEYKIDDENFKWSKIKFKSMNLLLDLMSYEVKFQRPENVLKWASRKNKKGVEMFIDVLLEVVQTMRLEAAGIAVVTETLTLVGDDFYDIHGITCNKFVKKATIKNLIWKIKREKQKLVIKNLGESVLNVFNWTDMSKKRYIGKAQAIVFLFRMSENFEDKVKFVSALARKVEAKVFLISPVPVADNLKRWFECKMKVQSLYFDEGNRVNIIGTKFKNYCLVDSVNVYENEILIGSTLEDGRSLYQGIFEDQPKPTMLKKNGELTALGTQKLLSNISGYFIGYDFYIRFDKLEQMLTELDQIQQNANRKRSGFRDNEISPAPKAARNEDSSRKKSKIKFKEQELNKFSESGGFQSQRGGYSGPRGGYQRKPLSEVKCHYCHELGHLQRTCRKLQNEQQQGTFQIQSDNNDGPGFGSSESTFESTFGGFGTGQNRTEVQK